MATSNQPSKINALLTIASVAALVVLGIYLAWQWTAPSQQSPATNTTPTPQPSSDPLNITDQFDQL